MCGTGVLSVSTLDNLFFATFEYADKSRREESVFILCNVAEAVYAQGSTASERDNDVRTLTGMLRLIHDAKGLPNIVRAYAEELTEALQQYSDDVPDRDPHSDLSIVWQKDW